MQMEKSVPREKLVAMEKLVRAEKLVRTDPCAFASTNRSGV